jgi:23S rRNA (adenine2503-C2)-methyltransferase
MDLQRLHQTLADRGEPAFRGRQVLAWAAKGARGYEQMTDLPASLREGLERELPFSTLELRSELRARDGTVKALFATGDGHPVEAVLMRYPPSRARRAAEGSTAGRHSICLSSQSGCPLTCTFCATGSMRFARNLTTSEIVDQALHFRRIEHELEQTGGRPSGSRRELSDRSPITHCVFMGMGEPMLNLDSVLGACERLPAVGVSQRRTAISTVGWIPGIERLTEQDMPLRLALSLHAPDDALRSSLMAVNDRYPLADVIEACRAFYACKRRRVLVEYVMLAGVNDRHEHALSLANALTGADKGERSMFKVNLIPYNPTTSTGHFATSTSKAIASFHAVLRARGLPASVRLVRGRDISAACGQLAARAS